LRSGELARQAGVSSDTLRHYERLGLLAKPPRSNGGYRDYPGQTLERVHLIRRALAVGFSLPELSAILKIRDAGGVPCHRVRVLAEAKLAAVGEKIGELVAMRRQLEQTLKSWDAKLARVRPGEQARLLEALPDETTVLRGLPLSSDKNRKAGRK
jgi:MerR family transcriptional regulator, mercuric resistance operon regulatory protein